MLFLGVKPKVSHKWFRKTICSVDIILYVIFYLSDSILPSQIRSGRTFRADLHGKY